MRRTLGAGLLIAGVLAVLGGVTSRAGDDEAKPEPVVLTGWVHELAALHGGGGLGVRLRQADGTLSSSARVQGDDAAALLRTAFASSREVTVIYGKHANGKRVVKGVWLRAAVPDETTSPEEGGTYREAFAAVDGTTRTLDPWPLATGEALRPSQLLEEIKTWAHFAASGGAIDEALEDDLVAKANAVEALASGGDHWPWPYVHLRALWGKAALVHDLPPEGTELDPWAEVAEEWTEIRDGLAQLVLLQTPAPAGSALPVPVPDFVWPHVPFAFATPEALLHGLRDMAVAAFDGGRIDDTELFQLIAAVDRCLDPLLHGPPPANTPVCDMAWPKPYRQLVGIWGKAALAEVEGSADEWDEVLLAIDAFPDEIEVPRGG